MCRLGRQRQLTVVFVLEIYLRQLVKVMPMVSSFICMCTQFGYDNMYCMDLRDF